MKITKVMIAGVDNQTSIKELEKIYNEFPFVEWGVLYSSAKNRARYPNKEFIDELCDANAGEMSAHFCGSYSRDILENGNFDDANDLHDKFTHIQLNYNFHTRVKYWNTYHVIKFLTTYERIVILQNNKSNHNYLIPIYKQFENIDIVDANYKLKILQDASGGRGKEITHIPKPSFHCNYGIAGGINEDNIVKIAKKVIEFNAPNQSWLDLESGARTDNKFDTEKVKRILNKVQSFIN